MWNNEKLCVEEWLALSVFMEVTGRMSVEGGVSYRTILILATTCAR